MKTQIPIYRGRKIDSDEYIEGYLIRPQHDTYKIQPDEYDIMPYIVDSSTLAIHFLDMIDSEGNKIFASLSEDGKGGTIVKSIYKDNVIAIYDSFCMRFEWKKIDSKYDREMSELLANEIKVTGIQE